MYLCTRGGRMGIGTNIKKRRYELKMTQQDLATAMGYMSKSTIAKIESGENGVSSKKLLQFAKILSTTPEELVAGSSIVSTYCGTLSEAEGHKNIAVILAGGKSTRNQQNIPNQFISVFGKPIIIYSMEAYQKHPAINEIYVVCIKGWEDIVISYAQQFGVTKLKKVLPSGETGILSIKSAVDYLNNICNETDTIIFQESTRPLVTEENISRLLLEYKEKGSAATCGSMSNHLQFFVKDQDIRYVDRDYLIEIQSPEAYQYGNLVSMFKKAVKAKHAFTESCCSMFMFNLGMKPNFFEGNLSNIKIIRAEDIALFTAYIKQY